MRINMQAALASYQDRHLAAAANTTTHPSPVLPDTASPPPESPQSPEHESAIWLRAVVEGDKAAAEAARGLVYTDDDWTVRGPASGAWEVTNDGDRPQVWQSDGLREWVATDRGTQAEEGEDLEAAHAAHIAIHDPQDVIARCEAELRILDLHRPYRYGYCLACDPDSCGCVGSGSYPCDTIEALLWGYRHRDGFKPEWVNA